MGPSLALFEAWVRHGRPAHSWGSNEWVNQNKRLFLSATVLPLIRKERMSGPPAGPTLSPKDGDEDGAPESHTPEL